MPTTLSVYTYHLLPLNHPSCPNVPSESYPMILHTIRITPYQYNHATSPDIATPVTTFLPYKIPPTLSRHILCVSQCLRLSVTPFLPHHARNPTIISKFLLTPINRDSIALLCSRSSENILQWSWLLWILLVELRYCLYAIYEPCRFRSHRILSRPPSQIL
jgi:hypothetical protein